MTGFHHLAPARFEAVLVGADVSRGEAAVVAAGGAVVAGFGWDEPLHAVEGRPVLVVEAEGTDEATLAAVLPRVARWAAERDGGVVAFDRAAIDIVAAYLSGRGVELLCEPSIAERAAALVRAASPPAPQVREDREGEDGFRAGPPASGPPERDRRSADATALRQAILARRMRDGFFAPGLFAEPAWDMLLDLYAAELEGERVSVSSLCIAAAVAPTTALRWVARLTDEGLLERQPDPGDRRRVFMALTPAARAGMRGYLLALRRAGLRLA